ncbi:LysR family transcriptional regulator [Streptosporangium minutum]|uniref:HTH lysR-type domain-containing protein n=1 Tax=Streptosporangium minutum TaxID=569862 RepID=A0A243REG4_9ACTN|nr:hypothetical protein CA984_27680 [Streptosporangium minutum]
MVGVAIEGGPIPASTRGYRPCLWLNAGFMRLRQLEYFIAICEHGSFSAAANQLLVAQPSLSQQIRALERELGAELLERGVKGSGSLRPAGCSCRGRRR